MWMSSRVLPYITLLDANLVKHIPLNITSTRSSAATLGSELSPSPDPNTKKPNLAVEFCEATVTLTPTLSVCNAMPARVRRTVAEA